MVSEENSDHGFGDVRHETTARTLLMDAPDAFVCIQCRKRPATDDSSLCKRHLRIQRKRDAEYRRAARQANRALGLCAFCPLVSTTYRCPACYTKAFPKQARKLSVRTSVDKTARIAAVTKRHEDGRTRYHGQARRGNQPHEQLDAQDREAAARMMDAGFTRLGLARSPQVLALPLIQRKSVKLQACQEIDHGIAFLEAVLQRNGFTRPSREELEGDDE